jgi:DNA replication and repair protein RecF
LRLERLHLKDFRNYQNLDLLIENNITIFVGNNAQGKTNILESIYLLATGRSHRTNKDQELLRWNCPFLKVQAHFVRRGSKHIIEYRFSEETKRKTISLDGIESKTKDIIGEITTVFFSPEDLQLVKGMPALRRRFIDMEISQVNPAYFRYLQQYNRVLLQRNNTLRLIREKKQTEELLDIWDTQIAEVGAKIIKKRIEAIKKLAILARLMHRKITNGKEELNLQYESRSNYIEFPDQAKKIIEQELLNCRKQDILKATTSIGPHRDDLSFMVNDINLRIYGSQGQQRTGVLALKLAELEYMKSETGEYPVLLLDDVLSELDEQRRKYLVETIKDRVQTLITTTEINNLDIPLSKAEIVYVESGHIRREKNV